MANPSEINKLKTILENESSTNDEILDTLKTLEKHTITADLIRSTKIGVAVGTLKKRHSDSKIIKESTVLVERWKKVISEDKAAAEKAAPSPKTELKKESNSESNKRKPESKDDERESLKIVVKRPKRDSDSDDDKRSKSKKKSGSNDEDSKIRTKVVEMLAEAFGTSEEYNLDPSDVANEIEQELFKKHGGANATYKAKVRSLQFNIKNPKNPDLRQTVMQGAVTATQLINMSAVDMASPELKEERQKWSKYHMEASKAQAGNQTTTDMFKCGKCGRRETTYYQMQTRSADEPMTTFHTCARCGARWKS